MQIRFISVFKTNANCVYGSGSVCIYYEDWGENEYATRIPKRTANAPFMFIYNTTGSFSPANSEVCILKRHPPRRRLGTLCGHYGVSVLVPLHSYYVLIYCFCYAKLSGPFISGFITPEVGVCLFTGKWTTHINRHETSNISLITLGCVPYAS